MVKLKQISKKTISILLSATMLISGMAISPMGKVQAEEKETDYGLSNPRVTYNTRDTVYFGNYWQEDTNNDGVADQNDAKTPIRWQILEEYEDGTALVMSDKILDVRAYNDEDTSVTWKTSTVRYWLNNDFYDNAFSANDKADIIESDVVNDVNFEYGTDGGENTKDNVFLLSLDEVINTDYKFDGSWITADQGRKVKVTAYAKNKGASISVDDTGWWWLRSPGNGANRATYVYLNGNAYTYGSVVNYKQDGIRPALRINISSSSVKEGDSVNVSVKGSEWDTVTFGTYEGKAINWRVLNVNGDDAFLVSDKVLTRKKYNDEYTSITWKDSTIRKWLNEDFINSSFSDAEKEMIKTSTVINSDNEYYGTEGGDDTNDKVFFLSLKDIERSEYGFPDQYEVHSKVRAAKTLDGEDEGWWLRSPGDDTLSTAYIFRDGYVKFDHGVDDYYGGVRPALHIDLSISAWEKGGEEPDQEVSANFEYTISENEVTIDKYKGSDSKVVVPATIEGKPVTTIGVGAFNSKETVTEVQLPDSITSIGKAAFWWCTNLTKVNVPSGITNIADSSFAGCKFTDFEVPEGVTSIGDMAFYGCYDMTTINLPSTLTSIGECAFWTCKSLDNVTIPNSVTSIGRCAFWNCFSLKSITLPNQIETINFRTFDNCSSLEGVDIPDSVKEIGYMAFGNCTNLKKLEISKNVTSIDYGITLKCENLTSIVVSPQNTIYNDGNGCNAIIETASNSLIAACPTTNIPDYIKRIGRYSNLNKENVILPDSVSIIDEYAFYNCKNIKTIRIPKDIKEIKNGAFASCNNLMTTEIPAGITTVSQGLFNNCANLKKVVLPESIKSIELSAFMMCTSLTDINIPNSVTSIGKNAFYGCSSLKNIELPDGVTSIGESAFCACDSLTEFVIPKGVTELEIFVFEECKNLTKVTIPSNVKMINDDFAFRSDKLKEIWVEKGSYAETWAKSKGYTVKYITEPDSEKPTESTTEKKTVKTPAKVTLSSVKNTKAKKIVVKWKKASNSKGYEVQYALNKKFTKSKKTKTTTKTTLTINKLKKNKTYFVRVRAYTLDDKGNKKYGKWSGVKKVKIKK